MKTLLQFTTSFAFAAGLLFAQPQPPDPVARLTALLDLTTTQVSQVQTIVTGTENTISPLKTTLQSDQSSLNAAITANNSATIDSLAAAIGTLQGQVLDAHAKAAAQIYALLTAAQQAKVTALGGVGALLGGGGPGHGGPPPPM